MTQTGSVHVTELWRSGSTLRHRAAPDRTPAQQMPGTDTPAAVCRGLQSPIRRGCSRFSGLNNADSPGDGEVSQDIVWDSTSPTQAHTGSGVRSTRVVEISDIVNRIAPKDVKPKTTESVLLQWIGDSDVPSTPEIPVQRVRKRSTRQNSVDDLMKLARQFDQNMQQDRDTKERLNIVHRDLSECVTTSEAESQETSSLGGVNEPRDPVEVELHALFDCSTQKISGRLSQGSAASAHSQETQARPAGSAGQCQTLVSSSAAEGKGSGGFSRNSFDDFDDDWENDDLLNDSIMLAMTQSPEQHQPHKPHATLNPTHLSSASKPAPSHTTCRPRGRLLQELCPKVKTTNRSTFQLKSNHHFQEFSTKQVSSSATAQPATQAGRQSVAGAAEDSTKDVSDSLWGDGDDDALLYQVCDSVERISNSQPQRLSPCSRQEQHHPTAERQRKTTAPLPIDTGRPTNVSAGASRHSPCAFVRSNSLPGTSCETAIVQGWNVPMKGANNKSQMSRSLPGSRLSLGTFSRCRDSSAGVDTRQQNSCHTAFKRNVSDSAAICSKVFVTSQMTGKCSAAEIERKKQEALARRRQRMQNATKP